MAKATILQGRGWSSASTRLLPIVGGCVWLLLLYLLSGAEMLQWGGQAVLRAILPLGAGVALSILPGLALLRALWPDDTASWAEELGLAWGISVALPPLLLQFTTLVGLRWNLWSSWAYLLVAAVMLVWLQRRDPRPRLGARRTVGAWHALLLMGMLVIGLLVRLYAVRDLPVGMWGDSYHHTMIAQLLVDHGGLFTSWEPYAPLTTFTYHFGFHANAAFFHWLTGVPVTHSVVIMGQVLNAASLAVAYALATRFTGNQWVGLWAVALTGFANRQPAYYVNWGRYTQLTGHLILAAVLICWWAVLEHERWNWRRIVLAAIVTASLMLTHYIVTIFAALFLAVYVLVLILRSPRRVVVLHTLGRSAATAVLALVLAAPWLSRTLTGFLGRNLGGQVKQSAAVAALNSESALVAIAPASLSTVLLVLTVVGLLLALARRDWRVALFAVWSQLLVLSVVPHIFSLPGTGVITQFTAYIALYVTAIPLAAYAFGFGQRWLDAVKPRLGLWCAGCVMAGLSIWSVGWQQRIIDPTFQLFTPADAQAMTWIKQATPPDARFAVNMMPAYGNTLFAGTDGGWWITLLTGRETTLPPITYGSEHGPTPDYYRKVNALGFALREHPLPAAEGIQLLRDNGIRYVYSGAHVGQPDPIDVGALRAHSAFRVVYARDGVTIFELVQE